MAKNSSIEWTHHTFNPWWGCAKVSPACAHCYAEAWAKRVGQNVWGGSADRRFFGDKHWAERRLPLLLQHAARRRFLSCEPLLGPIDLSKWTKNRAADLHPIDWIIAGGESGPGARPMLPGWARQLRDQCGAADISFHFKQWGHWAPTESVSAVGVEKFWDDVEGRDVTMRANGKKVNGRSLDGQTWDQLPVAA